jgi:N-acetylglucosaminyldiphosphoundecaprenol N-acetyl-beta-D-mannosaminyltransferase
MKQILVNKIIKTENTIFKEVLEKKRCIYTFLNPVSYLDALKNKELFSEFDGIFADGSLLIAAIRLLYGQRVTRRSFDMTSVAPELLGYAQKNNKTIYIVASKQEQVKRATEIFQERYPGITIVGYRNGYFSSEDEQEREAQHIVDVNPDFLIVGMGAVMQEKFLLRVKHSGYKGIGFTCGGFIHQTSNDQIDYYPACVDRINIRFLYRMYKEPHTRKRYLEAGLIFPIRFIWGKFFG